MDFLAEFEKMRPYNDLEVPEAIDRILKKDQFRNILSFLYHNKNIEQVIQQFRKIKTVSEFQALFSHHCVREIVRQTSDGLTYSGVENLDNNTAYLFISNHRDIVLDSAIMQVLLYENNHRTSQITFGSNLMSGDLVITLGKLNKMFTFYRGGPKLQMYKNALLHSSYIRKTITEDKESIWIAQRDGRTKDGEDKTQVALIKMLAMGEKNTVQALMELNIVPVTVSYEYEPCDAQKLQEVYISKYKGYKKQPGEDLSNILNGIKNPKGKIHFAFGKPINQFLNTLVDKKIPLNELVDIILHHIDNQIYKDYAVWKGNFIAYDILMDKEVYFNIEYNQQEKDNFIAYIKSTTSILEGDKDELESMLVRMYAMPLVNRLK